MATYVNQASMGQLCMYLTVFCVPLIDGRGFIYFEYLKALYYLFQMLLSYKVQDQEFVNRRTYLVSLNIMHLYLYNC